MISCHLEVDMWAYQYKSLKLILLYYSQHIDFWVILGTLSTASIVTFTVYCHESEIRDSTSTIGCMYNYMGGYFLVKADGG